MACFKARKLFALRMALQKAVHILLEQFSTSTAKKLANSATSFCNIVTNRNDQKPIVNHVVHPLDVFFLRTDTEHVISSSGLGSLGTQY